MIGSSNKWIIRAPQTDSSNEQTFYNRNRKNVITLFDVYSEVNGRLDEPQITYSYPQDFNDDNIFNSIRRFTFPCGKVVDEQDLEESAVQLFTFVLTEGTGNFTYGYCRFAPRTGTCTCIMSGYYFTSLFYKLLNHLAMLKSQDKIESVLSNGYHLYVPRPGERLELNQVSDALKFTSKIPVPGSLSTLNDDKILMEFFNVVEDNQMIALFTALLFERRIIITGKKLSQLTACCFALTKIIYPFFWQYTFIPLLPQHLIDILSLPAPYIIGLPKELYEKAQNKAIWSDYVLFDLDTKIFESPHESDNLPTEINVYLKHNLKQSSNTFLSDNFSRTFLRAITLIFGKYKAGFTRDPETKEQVYDLEKFINESRSSIAPFLREVMLENGASYFDGFVTEKLRPTTKRRTHDQEFENEIVAMEKRGFSLMFLQSTAPEALQSAMNNVKDGATDVLGSLKGKMQSISIKDKFGRFTPKSSRKTKLKNIDPMFVDASQYRVSSIEHQESSQNLNGDHAQEENEPEEEDLIDFSDPTPPHQQASEDKFADFFKQQSTKTNGPVAEQRNSGSSIFYDMDPLSSLFTDSTSPSTSSSNRSSNRQSNGSYEIRMPKFPEPPKLSENGQKKTTGFSNWEKFE
ncbi:UDENN domain-containing protein [Aphelenchoides bicaudatus]|nr:UDENN domain-containing protein [Aphelenchoides bicaudatus]